MKRRNWKMVALAALTSVGLSACTIPAAQSVAQNTYGSSPYLQVHFTATLTSADPSLQSVATALAHLRFDLNEQSTTGAPIKSSLNQINQDLVVWHANTRVATILESKSNVYLNVDFSALSRVPGMSSSASSLAALNLLLGQRWIELPYALVAQYTHSAAGLNLTRSALATGPSRLLNAVVTLLAHGTTTSTATGVHVAGSSAQLARALAATLKSLGLASTSTVTAAGSYALDVTLSGTTATALALTVTTPSAKHGPSVLRLAATIAHQTLRVDVPSSPLVITPALVKQLGASGGSLLSGSLG